MTDNTNDAEKTPKPRAPRKSRKVAEAVAPSPVPGAGEAERVEKASKPRAPRKSRKVAEAVAPSPVPGEGEAERVERVEKIEVVAEDSGRTAPDAEPRAEQAERDARAAWFERAERTRREERAGWTPWARPGEREEPVGGEERAGRDERAEGGKDSLGTAAEEALKLFDTLQQKAARELRKNLIKGTMTGFGSAFSGGGRGRERDVWEEAVSEHEEYICRACPVCRAMAAQRESGTAVTDHLMQAGTELFAAFKSAVDGLGKSASGQRAREREDTPVEHIDLG